MLLSELSFSLQYLVTFGKVYCSSCTDLINPSEAYDFHNMMGGMRWLIDQYRADVSFVGIELKSHRSVSC